MIWAAMAVAQTRAFGVNLVAREARFPRLVALVLDTILIGLISLIATNVYGVTVVTRGSPFPTAGGFATWSAETTIPGIWTAVIWIAYYTVCEAMFGATPGKALTGLVVVSTDGRPLTVSRVLVRNVLRLVDVLPGAYVLGGLFVLSSVNSQRIGDLVAHSTVALRRRVIQGDVTRTTGRSARLALACALAVLVVFTALFDYFGRPALVIQSAYNQNQLFPDQSFVSYSLGNPSWTLTTVTYPISARTPTKTCTGSVSLYWDGLLGWQMSGGTFDCRPS